MGCLHFLAWSNVLLLGACINLSIDRADARDFYRWVDKDGVLHFDTHKPDDTQATVKTVDANAGKKSAQNLSSGCKTVKCQENLQRLMGKGLPEAAQGKTVVKPGKQTEVLKAKTREEQTGSSMQRLLDKQAHSQKTEPSKQPVVDNNALVIPKNYTLIKPNKARRQQILQEYGTPVSDKVQKNQDVMDKLFDTHGLYLKR